MALRVEVRLAQLNRGECPKHPYRIDACTWEVPSNGDGKPKTKPKAVIGTETRDLQRRWYSLECQIKRSSGDERVQFWVACVMREMIAEDRIKPEVAVSLLEGVGVDRRVIAAAFLTVEDKLGKEKSDE